MAATEREWLPVSAGGMIPDEFLCPISGAVMHDPVWLDTGITVDRAFAAYYMQVSDSLRFAAALPSSRAPSFPLHI